jgi:hypothetical protein
MNSEKTAAPEVGFLRPDCWSSLPAPAALFPDTVFGPTHFAALGSFPALKYLFSGVFSISG